MNYKTDTKRGLYTLKHPEKYISNTKPVYKSGWEKGFFDVMDTHPSIIHWGYECVDIYYRHPLKGQSIYKPDIFCIGIDSNGNEMKFLIEIKPHKMTIPPSQPSVPKSLTAKNGIRYKKALERYKEAVLEYAINEAKWIGAKIWCSSHGIQFQLVTEKNTGNLFS